MSLLDILLVLCKFTGTTAQVGCISSKMAHFFSDQHCPTSSVNFPLETRGNFAEAKNLNE